MTLYNLERKSDSLEQRLDALESKLCCGKPVFRDTYNDFPIEGKDNTLYVDESKGTIYIWNGTQYITISNEIEQRICLKEAGFNAEDALNPTTAEVEIWADANNISRNGTQLVYSTVNNCDEPDFIWTLNGPEITLSYEKSVGITDHGALTGLLDDDHLQYHNDTRGDARYFTEVEHINASVGAGDAGKPIVLNAGGQIDASMINDADVDHGTLGGLTDDDHTQYLLLAGRTGGQTAIGGTAASNNLTLSSTSNATKGAIIFGDSRYNEATNRLVLGTSTGTGRINLPDAGTTASDGISFGSTISLYRASSSLLRTNNEFRVDGTFNCASATNSFAGTGYTLAPIPLTGSSATSALNITQTWNTTGNPSLIFANVTNTASGASANLMDLQVGGVSAFKISKVGGVSAPVFAANGYYSMYGQRFILQQTGTDRAMIRFGSSSGCIALTDMGETNFDRLQFGGITALFPAWKRNTTNLEARLADDSAQTGILANNINFGTTTGTGRINLPDAGTTASDGIHFGTAGSIYRENATRIAVSSRLLVGSDLTVSGVINHGFGGGIVINGTTGLNITPNTLTGSTATSALNITQTWNTTGSPTAINVDITNTASGASANFLDFKLGGVSQARITRAGRIQLAGGGTEIFHDGIITTNINSGRFSFNCNRNVATDFIVWGNSANTTTTTSGTATFMSLSGFGVGFTPTSGNGVYNSLGLGGIINQTGGANGITRSILVQPTLTAAADYRGAEFVTPSNTVIIGRNTTSAAVEVSSTTQGFLPPRLTTVQRDAIASPVAGLTIYCTDATATDGSTGVMQTYNGTAWKNNW